MSRRSLLPSGGGRAGERKESEGETTREGNALVSLSSCAMERPLEKERREERHQQSNKKEREKEALLLSRRRLVGREPSRGERALSHLCPEWCCCRVRGGGGALRRDEVRKKESRRRRRRRRRRKKRKRVTRRKRKDRVAEESSTLPAEIKKKQKKANKHFSLLNLPSTLSCLQNEQLDPL